jgi:hypothetical protein
MPNVADSDSPSIAASLTYCGPGGVNTGISASLAYQRESCSFWDLAAPGSSPAMSNKPAPIPCVTAVTNGSAKTLTPTCLTMTTLGKPATDAPSACANAVFSSVLISVRSPCLAHSSKSAVHGSP